MKSRRAGRTGLTKVGQGRGRRQRRQVVVRRRRRRRRRCSRRRRRRRLLRFFQVGRRATPLVLAVGDDGPNVRPLLLVHRAGAPRLALDAVGRNCAARVAPFCFRFVSFCFVLFRFVRSATRSESGSGSGNRIESGGTRATDSFQNGTKVPSFCFVSEVEVEVEVVEVETESKAEEEGRLICFRTEQRCHPFVPLRF